MHFRVRTRAVATTAVATAVLLAGCSSTPAEELKDWWSSGGEARVKGLSDTSARVNDVSMRPMDTWGPACQELLTEVAKVKNLDTLPSKNAQGLWKEALTAFDHGGNECAAGAGNKEEARASAGIREVQKGIGRLAAAVSVIRSDLAAK
ncbi:hypothetical protein ADK52_37485 [Streptomyces sp. WM6372]|uniref:hypothetical protein n=1 Tax=Streptomyces sp. WM6372 TaxID=1415555 RepID=UPI0006AEA286|nr:hypothetical protein [Streptomyces sp. WM6372]KOU13710.1 hypothetical protein ADK52_37485 [Streptomyces sp. WM6372]